MSFKGRKFTEEHKQKLKEAVERNWAKPEYREHMSQVHKGQKPPPKSREFYEQLGKVLSIKHKGKNFSPNSNFKKNDSRIVGNKFREGKPAWNKGLTGIVNGDKNPAWKGGITPINTKLRNSLQYEKWRTSVFERDLYTCQDCGSIGEYLHADHIKSFSEFPDLRFELSNGRTLCTSCHFKKTFNKEIKKNSKWGHRKGGVK